jgi:hypothetical protein
MAMAHLQPTPTGPPALPLLPRCHAGQTAARPRQTRALPDNQTPLLHPSLHVVPSSRPPSFSLLRVEVPGHPTPPLPYLPPLQKDTARCHRASFLFPSSILRPKHPTGKTPLPVAFLTAPTVEAPPLTGNSAAPPMSSPLPGESCHARPLLPFSPIWAQPLPLPHSCRAVGEPRGNADHRPGFPHHRPPSR